MSFYIKTAYFALSNTALLYKPAGKMVFLTKVDLFVIVVRNIYIYTISTDEPFLFIRRNCHGFN